MKHWRKGLKRITAVALAVMMIGTTVDASALAVLAAEEVTEVTCNHVCDETCGGMQAVTGSALSVCTHVHDEECGYEEAEAECTCGTDDPAFHATNCPAYIAPENPQCYCAEKCTEDTLNIWCDVCGVQGVNACQGEDTAVAYEIVASGTCGAEGNESSVTWSLDSDGTLTISGSGAMADYEQVGTYYTTPWHDTDNDEKYQNSNIKKVVVEEGITHIGNAAFRDFTELTSISIPDTVKSIGYRSVSFCWKLESLVIPNSVTSIGEEAFDDNRMLTSVTIGNSVESIGAYAFSYAGVWTDTNFTITLPKSVTSIDSKAFSEISKGATIRYSCSYNEGNGYRKEYTNATLEQYHLCEYSSSGNEINCFGCTCGKYSSSTATLSLSSDEPIYYTGEEIKPAVTITYPDGWGGDKIEPNESNCTYLGNINAGTATCTFKYAEGVEASLDFTIEKVDSVITAAPTPADLVYDGTALNLINAGTTTDGEMQYSLNGTNYSRTIPTGTDAKTYTVWYKVVGDKNHNDTEPEKVEVSIAKGTPDIGTVSASNMENTLDVSQVVLSRSNVTVPGTLSLADGTTLQYGTKDCTYVFTPNDNINYETVTGTVSITVSDTNAPTATYKVGTDEWKQFINTITFGHFCKDNATVDITYSDEESGVADKQYYITEEEITNTENIQWSDYTDILNINATGKYYIYVRVTDNYGNVVIQNSEGIVVYAESVITPTSFSCEYGEENALNVNISANGNTFAKLTDGSGNEIATENYSIAGSTLTIKGEYLSDLDVGEYTYKICMNPQGVENTEVTLSYGFTIKVEKRTLTVDRAYAASRCYIANDYTVDITGVTLSGKQGTDDVSVNLTGVKGTLSSDNAGTYTSLTLPALTLTGADKGNYELVQPTGPVTVLVGIEKLNAEIIVEDLFHGKKFGQPPFSLGVSDNNPEAEVTYESDNEDVATVTSEGIVTIHKAGSAQITVSLAESTNYISAESKQIIVDVAKEDGYTVNTIQRNYLYSRENADTIDLSAYLPADCGEVTYGTPAVSEGQIFSVAPTMNGSVLGYSVAVGEVSDAAQIKVTVNSDNYADFTITVVPVLVDQMPVSPKTEVTLTNDTITYGDALSEMSFEEVVFEDEAGNEVAGTLAWKEAAHKPEAGTTSATWVFTPDNREYAVKEGSVAIVVKKATPVVVVPTVAERVYNPSAVLADSDLSGGSATGVDGNDLNGSWSWKVSGTVPVVNNSGYEVFFAPADMNNYETVTKKIVVTVTKATPVIEQVSGTTITYGDSLAASTVSGQAKHSNSVDMTVAGSFAWKDDTLKPTAVGSDTASYAVVFTPTDTTNYNKVETLLSLTVNKAENAPNMPSATMNVSYDTETVGAVTLPTGWEWKTEDVTKTLTIGEAVTAIALYKGTDAGNYETETVEVAITRSTCSHSDTEIRNASAASCTVDGYTGDTYCKGCGERISVGQGIPAPGHDYKSEVTTEATTTNEGVRTYTCENCGDSYTESIPKLPAPTSTPTPVPSPTATPSPTPTVAPTSTPTPVPSPTAIPSPTPTVAPTGTPTPVPSPTATPSPTPTVAPTGTPTPAPTQEPEKLPHIQDEDGKSGWDVIGDEIEKVIEDAKDSEEKAVVTVDMNGVTKVPKDIFEQIAGKDVSVEFILDNGLMWTVNGKTVNTEDLKEIDFAVTVESEENPIDSIPVKVINMVTGEWTSIEIQLAHSGEFGFEAVLNVNLEEKNAGLYANLFFYNEDAKELEFICADVIAKDGTADLTFTHASDYLIVLSETSMEPKDEVEVPEVKEPVLVKGYTVQIGAFIKLANAEKYKIKGESLDLPMFIIKEGKYYKVQTDVYETREEAVEVAKIFSAAGLDNLILKTERLVTPGEEEIPETPVKPTTPVLPTDADKKKIEALAKEVIAGKWGNGTERKNRLTEAGYNYREVQDKVNELLK